MTIGERIKKIRQANGLSQKELGKKLNVSQQMIGQWETGKSNPKIETLRRIADTLEVGLWEIVELNQMDLETKIQEIPKMTSQLSQEGLEIFNKLATETLDLEKPLLVRYRQLNQTGQKKAIEQVELLTKVPEYRKENRVVPMMSEDDTRYINAAHPIDGASEEDMQFDEDIMDDENF